MISINDFTKSFERDNLLENINLIIHLDKRIALAGKNGSGKSTFLNCLIGREDFSGRIVSEDVKISSMEQESSFDNVDRTFRDYINNKKNILEDKKLAMEQEMGEPEVCEDEVRFSALLDKYNLLLANESINPEDVRLVNILKELKIDEDTLCQKISELSGGQKVKLRLAECLAKDADIYFLDEPTNHLDLKSSEWLENYIIENIKSLIVVSHDRYFLNKVVEEVWKIENKKIENYPGSYNKYEKNEVVRFDLLRQKFKDATRRKAVLMESVVKNRHWAMLTGNKSAKATADRLEREADAIEIGTNPDTLVIDVKIKFSNKKLHNCEIFRLSNLSKEFDGKILFENVEQEIEQGEKIAIIGENGAGKTTLLKILMGSEKINKGSIFRREKLKIGYFDQELSDINREKNVAKFIEEECGKDSEIMRATLSKYGFDKKFLIQKIGKLSGGEKGRLNLLRITMEDNEVLFLDEPTNNLDIHLKDSLEKAIKEFSGTVIIVSHDRHFMDKVSTRILEIKNKEIKSYKGNYSDYSEIK